MLEALGDGPKDIHSLHAAIVRAFPEERTLNKNRTGLVRTALANAGLVEPADQFKRNGLWRLTSKGKAALLNQQTEPVTVLVVKDESCKLVIRHTTKGSTYTFTQNGKVFVFTPSTVDQVVE